MDRATHTALSTTAGRSAACSCTAMLGKLLWYQPASSSRALLTHIPAFPGLPNWYRCMGKTVEATKQAKETSRQKVTAIFLKSRVFSTTNEPNRYQYVHTVLPAGRRRNKHKTGCLQAIIFLVVFPMMLPNTEQ